jgi:hypothetical protein
MRAACEPLRAPEPGAATSANDEVTLILWRDEATGSIRVRDDAGTLAGVPLARDAHTEVIRRSQPFAPAPRRRRSWVAAIAASLVVGAAATAAIVASRSSSDPVARDEAPDDVVVEVVPAVPVRALAAVPAPAEETEAAPVEVEAPVEAAEPALHEDRDAPEKRPEPRRRKRARQRKPQDDVVATPSPAEPAAVPVPPPAEAPAPEPQPAVEPPRPAKKRTLAESVRVLEGCSNRCATDARALAKALDEASFTGSKRGVIDFCVQRCLDGG